MGSMNTSTQELSELVDTTSLMVVKINTDTGDATPYGAGNLFDPKHLGRAEAELRGARTSGKALGRREKYAIATVTIDLFTLTD